MIIKHSIQKQKPSDIINVMLLLKS